MVTADTYTDSHRQRCLLYRCRQQAECYYWTCKIYNIFIICAQSKQIPCYDRYVIIILLSSSISIIQTTIFTALQTKTILSFWIVRKLLKQIFTVVQSHVTRVILMVRKTECIRTHMSNNMSVAILMSTYKLYVLHVVWIPFRMSVHSLRQSSAVYANRKLFLFIHYYYYYTHVSPVQHRLSAHNKFTNKNIHIWRNYSCTRTSPRCSSCRFFCHYDNQL